MSLEILQPGLLTTIQDRGRYGYQNAGIPVSGAMDAVALRMANLLVGNGEGEAGLEITWKGPAIRFKKDCLIALAGADLSAKVEGMPVKMWRPVYVREECVLEFGEAVQGCRAYLAVSGGFDIPRVMNSASTYLRGRIGGWAGRALRKGDVIPYGEMSKERRAWSKEWVNGPDDQSFIPAKWTVPPSLLPVYEKNPVIRAVEGPEYGLFPAGSKNIFWKKKFQINPRSDRMGYRLAGTLPDVNTGELISGAVTFGTVQVPPGGEPVVLLADRQATGGYPRIAQVITADFSKLVQAFHGDSVRFRKVSLQEAQQLYREQEQNISTLRQALQRKFEV